jgi:type IV pilus assembly protein PilQ
LGDIPLLGRLFRRTNNSKERSELVVLITPQILNDSDQSTYGYNYTPGEEAQKLLKR